MHVWILYVCLVLLFSTCFGQVSNEDVRRSHEKMNELMQHDGVKRIVIIDGQNAHKLIRKHRLVIVLFWVNNQKDSERLNQKDMDFLEVVAQLLQTSSVSVATCEIMANQKFAMDAGVRYTGMIKVFNKGKVTTYDGQRSPDVFVPYLSKMLDDPIQVIHTKSEKKQFNSIDLVKVIAFVDKDSQGLKTISEAALSFQPMIPFYVVHETKLAKTFHLKKVNSIQLLKPYEKSVSLSSKAKLTVDKIVEFVESNKRQRLTKMRLENIHNVWAIDTKGYIVPVFALASTGEGKTMFSIAKSLSKHFEKNENLSFVWIDPQPFPGMIEYWRKAFEIDPLQPTIGVVDVHTQASAWYKKQREEENPLNSLKTWLNDVLLAKIKLKPMITPSRTETTTKEKEEDENAEEDDGGKGDSEKEEL